MIKVSKFLSKNALFDPDRVKLKLGSSSFTFDPCDEVMKHCYIYIFMKHRS